MDTDSSESIDGPRSKGPSFPPPKRHVRGYLDDPWLLVAVRSLFHKVYYWLYPEERLNYGPYRDR